MHLHFTYTGKTHIWAGCFHTHLPLAPVANQFKVCLKPKKEGCSSYQVSTGRNSLYVRTYGDRPPPGLAIVLSQVSVRIVYSGLTHMHALISKGRLKPISQVINIYVGGEEEPSNQLIELHKSITYQKGALPSA